MSHGSSDQAREFMHGRCSGRNLAFSLGHPEARASIVMPHRTLLNNSSILMPDNPGEVLMLFSTMSCFSVIALLCQHPLLLLLPVLFALTQKGVVPRDNYPSYARGDNIEILAR
jgi:hypothetical protein